ncbi:hypothetical protein M758_12G092400 [Ceratodon purpureus]|uniref:BTB domain-containing protein n=1 Tax=Ceratodon purpureus TaxID=3225 RepID=A0A8T0G7F6_CERPU|nr:hypothetical protein KC19_12G089300 [Ceratodon purpureus]KAG0598667.1 hypothetical protein M758_12G092400 [Ceratodon purpureus]
MASSSGASVLNIDITKFISPEATNRKHIAFMIRSNLTMKMLLDGLNTDITLEAKGGSRFRAHTCVLAANSPVFNAIFKTRTEERVIATVPEKLHEMTIEGLKLFVVLLYLAPVLQDNVIMNGLENAVIDHFDELVAARLKFKVPVMDPILTKALSKILTPENCGNYLYYWMIASLKQR